MKLKRYLAALLVLCVLSLLLPPTTWAAPAPSPDPDRALREWGSELPVEAPTGAGTLMEASSGSCGEGVYWSWDGEGTLTVSGTGKMSDFNESNTPWDSYKSQIRTVVVSEGVRELGTYAFYNCGKLSELRLPESLRAMQRLAFGHCNSLKHLILPEGFERLSDDVFFDCRGLHDVSLPSTLTVIGSSALAACDSLTTITVAEENPSFCSVDGVVFSKDRSVLVAFPANHSKTYSVPNGVTTIGEDSFYGSNVTEVTLPETTSLLQNGAFYACTSLKTIHISRNVSTIGSSAFGSCYALKRIEIAGENENYCSINGVVFSKDRTKLLIYPGGHGLSYEIPVGTVYIESVAFYGCRPLQSVGIPTTVTEIGRSAFSGCSSLREVNYLGTPEQWSRISIGSYNEPLQNAVIHFLEEPSATYTVSYDANGGTGTPSAQTKTEHVPLTLTDLTPTKTYVLRYNANGGSVAPASKNLSCAFKSWNTEQDGTGKPYSPGESYTADEDVTLYAQWTDPTAGVLATPSRGDYVFAGWFTSAAGGDQITEASTVTENLTVYAHWTQAVNPYNLGDETYSFSNYGDTDSPFGHCFGMSITSAGYYNSLIDIKKIGGDATTPLYSFEGTQLVKQPICFYQSKQGSYSARAIVAGGSTYLTGSPNIASDWQAVVSYVRDHSFDHTGLLQIGFRKSNEGGHAINFLRYENVNGQDRIYAYDNNFPNRETYFYQDPAGRVWQAPVQTFSGAIDCIALRDCRIYFNSVGDFDATHVLYMARDAATVLGYTYSYMEGSFSDEEYVIYEIPADQDRVVIIPNRDHADFVYMDTEYSFGEITDETRGEFRFASMREGAVSAEATFRIFEEPAAPALSVVQQGTTLRYEIENFKSETMLLLADYDESGRMLRVQRIDPVNSSGVISVGEAAGHQLFLFDSTICIPLCAAWKSDEDGK